jgi:hypothetical protein
MGMVGGGEECL